MPPEESFSWVIGWRWSPDVIRMACSPGSSGSRGCLQGSEMGESARGWRWGCGQAMSCACPGLSSVGRLCVISKSGPLSEAGAAVVPSWRGASPLPVHGPLLQLLLLLLLAASMPASEQLLLEWSAAFTCLPEA